MKTPGEYADDGFEDEWLERMSPRERRLYRARRASVRVNGSDLTVSEWKEFGRLRALHGDKAAHDFHDAIRYARMAEERGAPSSTVRSRLGAAALTFVGRAGSGLFFILPATAFGGHLGWVFSASVVACVTCVATLAAYADNKAM